MNLRFILVTTILVFSFAFSNPVRVTALDVPDTSDVSVLILIGNYFGWNYFDAKECLESWGVNVTTVAYSLDYEVNSCLNREPRPITVDLLLSEMTPELIIQFDCLLVTSGGQWLALTQSEDVLVFISDAYELGLVVASICTGTRVVAEANNIVNGSKVTYYSLSDPQMTAAGAITILGAEAVADGPMITGGRGGGTGGGGWLEAPTSEVCAEIVRSILGMSRVKEVSVTPSSGPVGTNFTILAAIGNLNESLGDILSTDVNKVTAQIFAFNNRTLIDTIELSDDDFDGNYTGSFVGFQNGQYKVDIEVEDSNETIEVARELGTFEVETETVEPLDIVVISTVGVGSVIIALLVIALFRKR
jgi:putative intracellular protease/amidase